MGAPEPMLSTPARSWPAGGDWILQAKWDGFRVLIEISPSGRARAWSRHGTSLTARLGDLLRAFEQAPAGSVFDGELVAIGERDGRPVQDFGAVGRAAFAGELAAVSRLRFVAFDLLALGGEDLRGRSWQLRDQQLREELPSTDLVRMVESLPATPAAHEAIVQLGFEGTVLKRPGSIYRAGRHITWRKHKARHTTTGRLMSVHRDRDGQTRAVCDVEGRRVVAVAGAGTEQLLGEIVELAYSRVDADGTLREVRVAQHVPTSTTV